MSRRLFFLFLALLVALAVSASSCRGGGDNGGDAGPSTPVELTEADATAILGRILLELSDLPSGWTVMSDDTEDNATAIQDNPDDAGLFEQCRRLLSRTVTYQPEDLINAFLGGETLSFFSTATVYATEDGAATCAQRTAERLAEPGGLARQFGDLFIDPDAVVVQGIEWPTVGDASFAATLTGQIEAAGTVIDLTILVVGFRDGNLTGAVGSARSGSTPPNDELVPYVDLVSQRVADEN